MSCVISMSLYYRKSTVLTDQAKKATLLHTHTHTRTHEQTWGLRGCTKIAPPSSSWKHAPFAFTEHPPQGRRWLLLRDKWKGDLRRRFPSSPLSASPRARDQTAVSWGAASRVWAPPTPLQHLHKELSIVAMSSPGTYIVLTSPGLLIGGGQTPYSPLEISLETWKENEWERERQYYKLAFKFVN